MQAQLQDLFQGLPEELPGGGLTRRLHLWEDNDSGAGHELFQRQGQWHFTRTHPDTLQLRMAGKSSALVFVAATGSASVSRASAVRFGSAPSTGRRC